jgi:hypothetical protein
LTRRSAVNPAPAERGVWNATEISALRRSSHCASSVAELLIAMLAAASAGLPNLRL